MPIEIDYEDKKFKIVDEADFEKYVDATNEDGNDRYAELYKRCTANLKHIFHRIGMHIKRTGLNTEKEKTFGAFIDHINQGRWLYGIRFNKCDMNKIIRAVNNSKYSVNFFWADANEKNIIIVKDDDFMKLNKILHINSNILYNTGIRYIYKNSMSYKQYIETHEDVIQINIRDKEEFDNILPLFLVNDIEFEIYTNKINNKGIIFSSSDENKMFNIFNNTKAFSKYEMANIVCKRCIEHVDKNYFLENLDYSIENNIALISPNCLYGHDYVAEYLLESNYKLYFEMDLIGEF